MKRTLCWILAACIGIPAFLTGCKGGVKVKDYMEKWDLNTGGTEDSIPSSVEGGTGAEQNWCVWLPNDTFGKVLDFSTEGSYVRAKNTRIDLTKDFTLSAFIMAPPREDNDRMILSIGRDVKWYLSAENDFALTFEAKGLEGLESSGKPLTDGLWHHVMLTKGGKTVTYYVDGEAVKTCTVSGDIQLESTDVTLGADKSDESGFDGSMAEVAVIKGAKKPAEVTKTQIKASDNEAKGTRIPLKHGVVIDRPQYFSNLVPLSYTNKSDIVNCINMGFDHVKLQLVPEWMMDEDGRLIEENMEYICSVLDMVVDLDYQAILCVSPCASGINYNFKTKYLGSLDNFELLVRWYGELGAFIREKGYSADNIAIQIMTEPYDNSSAVSWTWMSDRLWGALRNELPDHTLITSADKSGNLEHVKKMSPTSDSNLIYSFTTYEPYTIGWSSAWTSQVEQESFWNYVGEIPYPVEAGVDYTQAIEDAIRDVPENLKSSARSALNSYIKGISDGGDSYWKNYYEGTLYDREWHMARAKSLDDWSQRYGGNIHTMCVEFGCYDSQYSMVRFGSVGPGTSDELRLEFIKDMRESFDAYDIGWSYWCYNEGFTVFDTTYHMEEVCGSPTEEQARTLADHQLLTDSLGLTPKFDPLPDGLYGARGAWSLEADELKSALPGMTGGRYTGVTHQDDATFGSVPVFGNGYGLIDNPMLRLGDTFTLSAYVKTTGSGTILAGGEEFLEKTDGVYNRLQLHTFDELHKAWGSLISVDPDCTEGTGCFSSTLETSGDIVFCWSPANLDLSSYLAEGRDGALHLSVYVDNASRIIGGQLELTSGQAANNDANEHSWDLGKIQWKNGWNDIVLRTADLLNAKTDITQINSARIYFNIRGGATIKIDDLYAYNESAHNDASYWELYVDGSGHLAFKGQGMSGLTASSAKVNDGSWHHVMVSCKDGKLTYFVDGSAAGTCDVTGQVQNSASADVIIGADIRGGSKLPGSVAQVAAYHKGLEPGNVWTK